MVAVLAPAVLRERRSVDADLDFTDLFCGAGGSIRGFVDAGLKLRLGANHSPRAIATVSGNHPDGDFLQCDINALDKRRLPRTRVLWASVICTEISPAGGRKKHRGQGLLDFEEMGHVPSDAYERTRACALDVVQATEIHRYEAVVVENVVEFARDWELYDWWVEGMCKLGYRVQVVNASAAHVYDEANPPAPQWRDRIYIVFTRLDVPEPDLGLRPPSWCFACEQVVEGVQSWKRLDRSRIGKYGQQYVFRCPNEGCRHAPVEPFVLPAAAAIDFANVGERIGDRKRPLAKNTMARIEWGWDTFVRPFLATTAGNTYESGTYRRVWPADDSPMPARTGTAGEAIVQPPPFVAVDRNNATATGVADEPLAAFTTSGTHHHLVTPPRLIVNSNHDDCRVLPAEVAPLPGRTTKIGEGVLTPFVTVARTGGRARSTGEPLAGITTGNNQYLTTPGFYVKNFGGNARPRDCARPLTDPLGTVTTRDHHWLVVPYRRGGRPRPAGEQPLPTISTVESAGLLATSDSVLDCFYRMLTPREHARGQRFPDSDVITGNIGEQTLQVGNAVPCNTAQWIGRQLIAALNGGRSKRRRRST